MDSHQCPLDEEGHRNSLRLKNHAKINADSKTITDYAATPANAHHSNESENFFDKSYEMALMPAAPTLARNCPHIRNEVCEKAPQQTLGRGTERE